MAWVLEDYDIPLRIGERQLKFSRLIKENLQAEKERRKKDEDWVCQPRRIDRLFYKVIGEEFIYLFLQGLVILCIYSLPFLSDWLPVLIDIEAMTYDVLVDSLHVRMGPCDTSRFCLKNFEIASRISSGRFFPIFSTLRVLYC